MTQDSSSQLRLTVFGPPQLARADGTAVTLRSREHFALLVYLTVEQRHSPSSDTLLALLWPDVPEADARNMLKAVSRGYGDPLATSFVDTHLWRRDRTAINLRKNLRHLAKSTQEAFND